MEINPIGVYSSISALKTASVFEPKPQENNIVSSASRVDTVEISNEAKISANQNLVLKEMNKSDFTGSSMIKFELTIALSQTLKSQGSGLGYITFEDLAKAYDTVRASLNENSNKHGKFLDEAFENIVSINYERNAHILNGHIAGALYNPTLTGGENPLYISAEKQAKIFTETFLKEYKKQGMGALDSALDKLNSMPDTPSIFDISYKDFKILNEKAESGWLLTEESVTDLLKENDLSDYMKNIVSTCSKSYNNIINAHDRKLPLLYDKVFESMAATFKGAISGTGQDWQKAGMAASADAVRTNAPTNGLSDEVVKIIKDNKEAAKKPIDEAEIQRRKKIRDMLRDADPSQALGQAINPERLAAEKEKSAKFVPIQNKMLSGKTLTADEKSFLREHYPEVYAKAIQIEKEIEMFRNDLKGCKSKEDAEKLYMQKKIQCFGADKNDSNALFLLPAIDEAYRSFS